MVKFQIKMRRWVKRNFDRKQTPTPGFPCPWFTNELLPRNSWVALPLATDGRANFADEASGGAIFEQLTTGVFCPPGPEPLITFLSSHGLGDQCLVRESLASSLAFQLMLCTLTLTRPKHLLIDTLTICVELGKYVLSSWNFSSTPSSPTLPYYPVLNWNTHTGSKALVTCMHAHSQ